MLPVFFNVASVQFCVSATWFSSVFSVVAVKLAELHHFCPMIFLCLTCVTGVATAVSILRQVIAILRQVIAGPMAACHVKVLCCLPGVLSRSCHSGVVRCSLLNSHFACSACMSRCALAPFSCCLHGRRGLHCPSDAHRRT